MITEQVTYEAAELLESINALPEMAIVNKMREAFPICKPVFEASELIGFRFEDQILFRWGSSPHPTWADDDAMEEFESSAKKAGL